MQNPEKPDLTPSAFASIHDDRVELLVEYLDDLSQRLNWIDNELAALGLCALCIIANGAQVAHECCNVQQA